MNHGGSADRSKRDYSSGTDDLSCNEKTHTVHKDYNNICLLSLNVCGIKQKLLYPELESLLNNYDILCLTETKLDDLDEIQCNDFIFHHKNRKKFINKSGGIALGYKSYLESFIKPITTDCQFVLWFSIDKKVFDSPENVIFGIVYVPPENSSYSSVEAFNDIEREFHKFNENTNLICLVGDFNARTGNLRDYIEDNDTEDYFVNNVIDITELTDTKILDELCIPKHRNSPDLVVNNFGRKLVDFCKNNNVFIYNGRIGNDKAGKSTSKNLSVVDYALSTAHLLKFVKHFEVLEFSKLYSDIHSPLSLVFRRD